MAVFLSIASSDSLSTPFWYSPTFIRNFEIIGEAVKKIPEEIRKKYADVEWKEAAGFRDVLIHDYFGIDLEAVWDTVRNNIPSFKKQIVNVLKSEKTSEEEK